MLSKKSIKVVQKKYKSIKVFIVWGDPKSILYLDKNVTIQKPDNIVQFSIDHLTVRQVLTIQDLSGIWMPTVNVAQRNYFR